MLDKNFSIAEDFEAYDTMWEWLDATGNKVNISATPTPTATPKTTTAFGSFAPQYQKLITYFQKRLTTNVIHCGMQSLTLEFPNTGNQLKLRIIQDPQNNCLICTLLDGSDKVLAKSTDFKSWGDVLDWLIRYGLVRPADRSLCEAKLDGTPTKKESKPKVEDYFAEITGSKAAVVDFIKNKLAPKIKIKRGKYADISTSYTQVIAKETSGNHNEIGTNPEYNYKAFTTKTAQFGIYAKDILHFAKTGEFVQTVLLTESCKFDFTKEDLDTALDKLTEEDDQGLNIGNNFEDSDVMTVAGEPYGGTQWYVDKWADNLYIITSELWGQYGGGPEDGVEEKFETIDEVWGYLSQLEQLSAIPALGPRQPEPPKPDPAYDFDKRFFKLVEYFRHNLSTNVKLISVDKITSKVLEFKEHYNNEDLIKYAITLFAGEPLYWTLKITKNTKAPDLHQGKDWENLLKVLRAFFPLPKADTTEYQDLLTEWVDNTGKKVTPTSGKTPAQKSSSGECCTGCGCVVEQPYDLFDEPYRTVDKQELCYDCLSQWVKTPDGVIDLFMIIAFSNVSLGANLDQVVYDQKLDQAKVDKIVKDWKTLKRKGKLNALSASAIDEAEEYFLDEIRSLGFTAHI